MTVLLLHWLTAFNDVWQSSCCTDWLPLMMCDCPLAALTDCLYWCKHVVLEFSVVYRDFTLLLKWMYFGFVSVLIWGLLVCNMYDFFTTMCLLCDKVLLATKPTCCSWRHWICSKNRVVVFVNNGIAMETRRLIMTDEYLFDLNMK